MPLIHREMTIARRLSLDLSLLFKARINQAKVTLETRIAVTWALKFRIVKEKAKYRTSKMCREA